MSKNTSGYSSVYNIVSNFSLSRMKERFYYFFPTCITRQIRRMNCDLCFYFENELNKFDLKNVVLWWWVTREKYYSDGILPESERAGKHLSFDVVKNEHIFRFSMIQFPHQIDVNGLRFFFVSISHFTNKSYPNVLPHFNIIRIGCK